jgi:murein DD-endopeptidase MepM/ murein hydrolase activator NlpD
MVAAALAVFAAGTALVSARHARETPSLRLRVSHKARAVAPGEALLLTIEAPVELSEVRGAAFGSEFTGYPGTTKGTWHALVGIDLAVKPGPAVVTVEARTSTGSTLRSRYPLKVAPMSFPARRLSVPPAFVTPPASERARIERERTILARVFAGVSPVPLWGDGFTRPTSGEVISRFGARSIYNGQSRSSHRGIDIRGATGTPVAAPAGGTVALAGDLYFSGTTVILDHGLGVFSLLCHLSRLDVREGAAVVRGDIVGAIGATGRVTGPHLHWTLRIGPASVDPMSAIWVLGLPR